ncbi:MAG: pyruvate oxidase, partial [Bacillota bacterium]|nr:pyruvate oxidase [Bacillota bacterium]
GKIKAGSAVLNVLKGWGVDTIYGIPSGTLGWLMDALAESEDINFIQVRHEETGALAADMQKKFGGPLGVAVGSGGPGASHLINGIYDAYMDHIPMLAIQGSRSNDELNLDFFQELNQNPMYEHVSVYNRRVANPQQLPKVIDEAARAAISRKGPAVVEIPVDFGYVEIDEDSYYSSGPFHRDFPKILPAEEDVDKAVEILNKAKRPLIYAGRGVNSSGDLVMELSKKIKAPLMVTGINLDGVDYAYEGLAGSAGRVSWKTGNELIYEADTILFIGSNFPFAEKMKIFKNADHLIQVDIDPYKLGKRGKPSLAVLADGGLFVQAVLEKVDPVDDSPWWRASLKNIENWKAYTKKLEEKEQGPLQFYQVYNAINKYADPDAIYAVDVGNTTQTSIRHLHMTKKNMWRTSPLFATMGIAIPGAIAVKKDNPGRQVWSLTGDGAFNMSYPDIKTNVQYKLPIINVVFANTEYAFIKNKYEETNEHLFGTDFDDVDYAKIAQALGAVSFTVSRIEEIDQVMKKAVEANKNGQTVVIDAKITNDRPFPAESMVLDPKYHSAEAIAKFKERYEAQDLIPFRQFLEEEGLEERNVRLG